MLSPFYLHNLVRPRMADYIGLPDGKGLFMEHQTAWHAENARLARRELAIMACGLLGGIGLTFLLGLMLASR